MLELRREYKALGVAPLAGAWVEIRKQSCSLYSAGSLPLRERGLKYPMPSIQGNDFLVAPLAGAWVEMPRSLSAAPRSPSLPLRERGLKYLWRIGRDRRGGGRSPCGSVG